MALGTQGVVSEGGRGEDIILNSRSLSHVPSCGAHASFPEEEKLGCS